MHCGISNRRKLVSWTPPPPRLLMFNVDSAARGKPRIAGVGAMD